MNIYLVEQDTNTGYDTYDSFVCVAETEKEARETHPSFFVTHVKDGKWHGTYNDKSGDYETGDHEWVPFSRVETVKVTLIGTASDDQKRGVVIASFNAG